MSTVTVAKTAGFCFGVRRAVELAEQQAEKNGEIWAYGEIIHNMHEITRLEKCGVRTAHTLAEIPDGAKVLIRAHGVPRAVYDTLADKKCEIFDATCPFVQKIHRIADEESRAGRLVVILGSAGTPRWRASKVGAARRLCSTARRRCRPLRTILRTRESRFPWLHKPRSTGQFGIFPSV